MAWPMMGVIRPRRCCKKTTADVQYIQNPPGYFVAKLHATHYGGVDDDKTLCRIVISRGSRDLSMIKELFKLRYDMDLFDYVSNTCHTAQRGLTLRMIAGYQTPEQRERMKKRLPKLVPGKESIKLSQRLSLKDAITIVMRKTQVATTLIRYLNVRRERLRNLGGDDDESVVEMELDVDMDEDEEERQRAEVRDANDEEDEGNQEAQEELRNNLKNLDLNIDGGDGGPSGLLSFAARKRVNFADAGGSDDGNDEKGGSKDEAGGNNVMSSAKTPSIPAPVQDPAFIGRRDSNFFERVMPFIKGRRKKYFRGTIKGVPMEEFNALKDAQAIGKALLQKQRNVEGILKFLITRNNSQRQLIVREFFRRYRRDLVDDLRLLSGTGNEYTIFSLLLAPEVFDSSVLFEAIRMNEDNKEDTLIEILCTRGNDILAVIKRAYGGVFGEDLREDLKSVTNGWLSKLLLRLMECEREEGDTVDEKLAQKDAAMLYEAHYKKTRDYSVYIEIATQRNYAHLQHLFELYAKMTKCDILESLEEDMSGDFLEALTAIVCNVRDAPMYFCERIYQSIAFHPMDDKMLIRCIVGRAEVDLMDIKVTFRRTYGRSLYNMIEKECTGRFKPYILEVVGKGSNK